MVGVKSQLSFGVRIKLAVGSLLNSRQSAQNPMPAQPNQPLLDFFTDSSKIGNKSEFE